MVSNRYTAVRLNASTYPTQSIEQEELAKIGAQLVYVEGQQPDEILNAARNCDALLVVSSSLPRSVILGLEKCRVISRLGAGTDKIDITAATEQGIVVTNVPDFCINEQAEHTWALLLAACRQLPYMIEAMRRGHWTARRHPDVHRLSGRALGLIGFGASAQAVAIRGVAFGMKVMAWARSPEKYAAIAAKLGVVLVSLDEILKETDYLSLHLPLNEETRGFLSAQRLGLLKSTAVLVNTARGALVDEVELISLLKSRRIRGAALDVFEGINVFAEPGPPPKHPFFELDNVILTPHCAGSSAESSWDSKLRGARQAAQVLSGIRPPHIVNPEVLTRVSLVHPELCRTAT